MTGYQLAWLLASVLIGQGATWAWVTFLRRIARRQDKKNPEKPILYTDIYFDDGSDPVGWLLALTGCVERAVVTALMIWAPKYVPAFIGLWVALKYVPGWVNFEGSNLQVRGHYMITLQGNVVSFAIAIAAGLLANPDAWTVLAG
jgi:hypothetical protein